MKSKEEIIADLTNYFAKRSDVVLAYLFGSQAKGTQTPGRSDHDIAVYFKTSNGAFEYEDEVRYSSEDEVRNDVEKITGTDVDLVVLNRAAANIVFSAMNIGIVLKEDDRALYWRLLLEASTDAIDFRDVVHEYVLISERSHSLSKEDRYILERLTHFNKSEVAKISIYQIDQMRYQKDDMARKALERWVEVVANSGIDIAKILLASSKREIPQGYSDMMRALQYLDDFDPAVATWLGEAVKRRNILAHEYLDLKYSNIVKFVDGAEYNYGYLVDFARRVMNNDARLRA